MLRESWQREKPTAPIIMENGLVIIAVEGPSAAGKTTWCRTQLGGESAAERFVAEYQPPGSSRTARISTFRQVTGQRSIRSDGRKRKISKREPVSRSATATR